MKTETSNTLLIISAILGAEALILIMISIFSDFKTNWVMIAGLGCAAPGCLINIYNIYRNQK